jgi:hypothetical protein
MFPIGIHGRTLVLVTLILGALSLSASLAMAAKTRRLYQAQPAAQGAVHVHLGQTMTFHKMTVTVPGRPIAITGVVHPYVPGQWLSVRIVQGSRVFRERVVRLKRRSGSTGYFTLHLHSPVSGWVRIEVSHTATTKMKSFVGLQEVNVLDDHVGFGSTGIFVKLLQRRLSALHFFIPQTGRYDSGTGLALDAYHRLLGMGTSQSLDSRTVEYLLDDRGHYQVRFPHQGRHAEADLSHQLLALINGSHVQAIFPISSGKPSTPTILGSYKVYYREPGYNSEGMYYSDFFIRGYAIHGYYPAPDYPASHGCLRLPISDAIWVYNWLALGDWVDVYN